jgi:hypothetical protein
MVCAWVNTATGSASYRTAFSSFLNASGGNNHRRTLRITDSDSVETDIVDGVGQSGALDGTHPNNTWFNMCGSWVSSASRSAWFNGGTAGNDTTSISPTTPDRTNIGSNFGNFSFPSAAGLAEISVWDLTGFTSGNRDSLAAAVAAGGNPLNITAQVSQPWSGKLVAYWPLTNASTLTDSSGNGHTLTMVGALTNHASHPTIDALEGGGGGGTPVLATAFHTAAEISNWQTRMASGPYKSDGDVSTNSPGTWDVIAAASTAFASNPTMDNWDGNTNSQAWFVDMDCSGRNQHSNECFPWHDVGHAIMQAALATIVDPTNHNRAANIRAALLDQIAVAGTDWTNSTKWPDESIGDGNAFAITNWLTRFALAYSFVRDNAVFSAGEKLSIDQWFSDAAYFWARNTQHIIANSGFSTSQRDAEFDTTVDIGIKYTTDPIQAGNNPTGLAPAYYDCTLGQAGPLAGNDHENWNNRSGTMIRFAAIGAHLNGSLANDAQTKRWVRMWFKEWLTYAVFSNGIVNEFKRYEPFAPNAGWGYPGFVIGSMSTVADIFARKGDSSLYDFSTSAGWTFTGGGTNASTAGGPKSLLLTIQKHASFVNQRSTGVPGWNAEPDNANCGNADYLIQPVDNISGEHRIPDTYHAVPNLYYRDATVKTHYMRTSSGAPAYPASPSTGAGSPNDWSGEWYVYPGVLFMYGQMENNAANPYLASGGGGGGGARRRLAAVNDLSGKVESLSPGIANVSLGWTDRNTAADQSEDGTLVDREVAGTFQQVGSVGPNVTQFSQSFSAAAGSQQCYQVRPVYSDGQLGADPSNEWCGTVPPCKQKGKSGNC